MTKPTVEVRLLQQGAFLKIGDPQANVHNEWAVTDKELLILFDILGTLKHQLQARIDARREHATEEELVKKGFHSESED
jgi:hypothetical protein